MKKKTVLALVIALCLGCAAVGFAACEDDKIDPPPGPVDGADPTLTLSETSLELDDYGSATLTATYKNGLGEVEDKEIAWSVEGDAVTVTNGTVQALGTAGTATVTATCGELRASCAVTVETVGRLPQVSVDAAVTVLEGATQKLTPSVTYGKDVQTDAEFTFTSNDKAVATVAADGTVTGVSFGTTTVTVKASWRGFDLATLTKTVNLSVREDIAVEIASDAQTIYTAVLELDGKTFTNTVKLESDVKVKGSSEGVEASKITWASSNTDIATVDNEGNVTANSTNAEGATQITLSYNSGKSVYTSEPVTVTVSYPVIDKTKEIKIDVESYKSTLTQLAATDVFGENTDKTIEKITEPNDSVDILENTTYLPECDAGDNEARTKTILVYNDTYAYQIKIFVVTKLISTYEDLTKLQEYAGGATEFTTTAESNGKTYTSTYHDYDGYFVLTQDIVLTGNEAPIDTPSIGSLATQATTSADHGFKGTFDGRGHAIVNLKTKKGGLFGDLGAGAAIRRLALVNATITERDGGLLCFTARGATLEHVFASYTSSGDWNGLLGHFAREMSLVTVVVYYNYQGGSNAGALVGWLGSKYAKETRVHVITSASSKSGAKVDKDENAKFVNVRCVPESQISTVDFGEKFNTTYWTIEEDSMPVFNSLLQNVSVELGDTSLTKYSDDDPYKLVATAKGVGGALIPATTMKYSSSDEGVVTVAEDGTLTFVAVGNATITVSYYGVNATCEVSVTPATATIYDKTELAGTIEVEVNSETNLQDQLTAAIAALGDDNFLDGVTVSKITTNEDRDTALTDAWLTTNDSGDKTARTHALIIYGTNEEAKEVGFKVNVLIVTKFITTYEHLLKMQEYGGVVNEKSDIESTSAPEGDGYVHYYTYSGYFVLKNDIIVQDTDPIADANCIGALSSGWWANKEKGFQGTFMGNGHSIVNLRTGSGGLFGDLGGSAVVRDFAVINAQIVAERATNGGAGVIAFSVAGAKIANIYVSYSTAKARSGVFGRVINGASQFANVVIRADYIPTLNGAATNPYSSGAITGWVSSAPKTWSKVLVIYSEKMATDKAAICRADGNTPNLLSGVSEYVENNDGTFKKITARDANGITYDDPTAVIAYVKGYSTTFWRYFGNNVPVIMSMYKDLEAEISQTELNATAGDADVQLTVSGTVFGDISLSELGIMPVWESSNTEVATVVNGKITFVGVGEATITATYQVYPSQKQTEIEVIKVVTCTVKVSAAEGNEDGGQGGNENGNEGGSEETEQNN